MKKYGFVLWLVVPAFIFIAGILFMSWKTKTSMPDDAKIEYRVDDIDKDTFLNTKNVYWRVCMGELKWWQRPFNPWTQAYFVNSGYIYGSRKVPDGELDSTKYVLFGVDDFKELKAKCHTLGEMKEHIRKSDEEFNRCNYNVRRGRKNAEQKKKNEDVWTKAIEE